LEKFLELKLQRFKNIPIRLDDGYLGCTQSFGQPDGIGINRDWVTHSIKDSCLRDLQDPSDHWSGYLQGVARCLKLCSS